MSARVWFMVQTTHRSDPSSLCVADAEPWWLVEAEFPDAARKVIEHFEHNGEACVHGRVLAHGGGK